MPDARLLLWERAEDELAEERLDPPAWAPFSAAHPGLEVRSAHSAARSRVEHTRRLLELPDRVLAGMLAAGWDPRPASADNGRYVKLRSSDLGGPFPVPGSSAVDGALQA